MNRLGLFVGATLLALGFDVRAAATATPSSLLPRPHHVQRDAGSLELHDGLSVVIARNASPRVQEIAEILCEGLHANAGLTARLVRSDATQSAGAVRLILASPPAGAAAQPEAYTLRVADNIAVGATDPRGLLWGVQTLLQSIDPAAPGTVRVPREEIADAPSNAWRALMLDPVRSFLDLDFVRRTVRVMSAYKLNILHLHLTDDHAWRFESKAFPRCNPPGEPFYSQAELRELVTFAQRYGVEIVPEFDFPGHAHAAVTAYPELDCEGKARPMDEAIFCSGKPFTWEFIDKVIAEAAAIFPSKYIHLGADEPFAVKRWTTCPHCQARMQAKGVTTTNALYHTFVIELDEVVRRHGKQMIVWNDAIRPGVAPMPSQDILVDAWVDPKNVEALATAGYTLVNSSNRPMYLSSYGQRQGFPLSAVWQWTPRVFGLRAATASDHDLKSAPLPENAHVIGGQACAWATDQRILEQRLYPRVLAVAETLWSGEQRGDFADFTARVGADQMARLHRLGVPDDDALPVETLVGEVVHAPAAADQEVLRTKTAQRDFILTFERRADENTGRTGFVIRCAPGSTQGFEVRSAPPPGMKIVAGDARDLKGWNRFELVARGNIISLTINGYLAWSVTDPAPRAGAIVLHGDGTGFDVRDVKLRALDP